MLSQLLNRPFQFELFVICIKGDGFLSFKAKSRVENSSFNGIKNTHSVCGSQTTFLRSLNTALYYLFIVFFIPPALLLDIVWPFGRESVFRFRMISRKPLTTFFHIAYIHPLGSTYVPVAIMTFDLIFTFDFDAILDLMAAVQFPDDILEGVCWIVFTLHRHIPQGGGVLFCGL